ncbi:unnamed protein product [Linum tenue]|uniref:Uncharacterized protein n=1 Tax=Linum tenue TaxID=586396 RepID=A0AAV0IDU0_9ROSI|nr:unnamed protein product [Linum tenue]
MTVEIDESFKKPGAVPFKWEIRPGVPKLQHHHHRQNKQHSPLPKKLSPPALSPPSSQPSFIITSRSAHSSPRISRSSSIFLTPPPNLGSGRSFRSAPRAQSERWGTAHRQQPELVAPSAGCFFNLPKLLLLRRRGKKSKSKRMSTVPVAEEESCWYDSGSDLESFSRWSVSSRRSLSPFMDSPASPYSYSSSSYDQFSPRPLGDAQWAGFGLF